MPDEIINICDHGVVVSDGPCPKCAPSVEPPDPNRRNYQKSTGSTLLVRVNEKWEQRETILWDYDEENRQAGTSYHWVEMGRISHRPATPEEMLAAHTEGEGQPTAKAKFFANSLRQHCLAPGRAQPPHSCGCTVCHSAKLLEHWGTRPPEVTDAARNLIESMGPHQDLPPSLSAVDRLRAALGATPKEEG